MITRNQGEIIGYLILAGVMGLIIFVSVSDIFMLKYDMPEATCYKHLFSRSMSCVPKVVR